MSLNIKHETSEQSSCRPKSEKRQMKSRTHRPIILLRRSSCGSIPRKHSVSVLKKPDGNSRAQLSDYLPKLPRLKSMSEIERMGNPNGANVTFKEALDVNSNIKQERFEDSMDEMWAVGSRNNLKPFLPSSSHNSNISSYVQPNVNQNAGLIHNLAGSQIGQNVSIKTENLTQSFPQALVMDPGCSFQSHLPQPMFGNPGIPQNELATANVATSGVVGYKPYSCPARLQLSHAPFLKNSYLVPCDSGHLQQEYMQDPRNGGFYTLQNAGIQHVISGAGEFPSIQQNPSTQISSNSMSWVGGKRIENTETTMVDDSLTNITWLGRMGVNNFLPMKAEKERRCFFPLSMRDDKRGRPPYSYMALIQFAINSAPDRRMTLRQIYLWIEEKFPYFKHAKPGWKNSIRHNLSLHDIFVREVSPTSKASYWTLRPDLNIRPLTLESVKGGTQHAFQACQPNGDSLWPFQTIGSGQKPLLPRLPPCSQPYILLPVPLSNNSPKKIRESNNQASCSSSSTSFQRDCSSAFADSGIHSDMSILTPSTSRSRLFSGHFFPQSGGSELGTSLLTDEPDREQPSQKPQQKEVKKETTSRKRARKEPLKTLNDSLNNSLHFVKEEPRSGKDSSFFSSPEPFDKVKVKSQKKQCKENFASRTRGISEDSFSEMMNDLGTPFKALFSRNNLTDDEEGALKTPPKKRSRKSRIRISDCLYSPPASAAQSALCSSSEKAPSTSRSAMICMTPEKNFNSTLNLEPQQNVPHQPTSTPVCNDKFGKKPSFELLTPPSGMLNARSEDKNNAGPTARSRNCVRANLCGQNTPLKLQNPSPQLTSPIFKHVFGDHGDISSDFMSDLMGVMFKTPDKPAAFSGLTLEDGKIIPPNLSEFDKSSIPGCSTDPVVLNNVRLAQNGAAQQGTTNESPSRGFLPSIFGGNNMDSSVFNNSFSKLLDLSGISLLGASGCSTSQLADLADVSWSNLANI